MRKILTHGVSKDLVWAVANSRRDYFKKFISLATFPQKTYTY